MVLKLAAIALALFVISTAVNAVTQICNRKEIPDKALCSVMTKDAPTWAQAMTNAVKYQLYIVSIDKLVAINVGSELPKSLNPTTKNKLIDLCRKTYYTIEGNLHNKALGYIKSDPKKSLVTVIKNSFFRNCTDEIVKYAPVSRTLYAYNNLVSDHNLVLAGLALTRPKA